MTKTERMKNDAADFWKPVTKIRDVGRLLNPADEAVKWLQTPLELMSAHCTLLLAPSLCW